jgi:hypothetical protein
MTLCKMTLSKMTLSITVLTKKVLFATCIKYDTHHCKAECHNFKFSVFYVMLNDIMVRVIILIIIMLNALLLCAICDTRKGCATLRQVRASFYTTVIIFYIIYSRLSLMH